MNYFDTSALVKRFVEESGSRSVAALLERDPLISTSKIAYAELHAGLARKLRERALSSAAYKRAAGAVDTDWPAIIHIEVTDELLREVRSLVSRHPLRGFDAIHLASALRFREQLGEEISFIASDDRLLGAAAAENFQTIDVRK